MAVVFFSGGVDSTTLAFDVAQHPARYGVLPDEELVLLTYGDVKKKSRALKPLLDALCRVSQLEVRQRVVAPDALTAYEPPDTGFWETLSPLASQYPPDVEAMPYTPGLHLWLASLALNEQEPVGYTRHTLQQMFFGFMYDGPTWLKHDDGSLRANDTSPAFVQGLNDLFSVLKLKVRARAPYYENRMNKVMIVELAKDVGVPLKHTSSCVKGWMVNCGRCWQCLTRAAAIREVFGG